MATGVLVLGIGKGTKVLQSYLNGSKAYTALRLFGSETDTQDSDGNITNTAPWEHISNAKIEAKLQNFRGDSCRCVHNTTALKSSY